MGTPDGQAYDAGPDMAVPYDESEIADAFDVYVVPVGPVVGYDAKVDTAAEAHLTTAVLQQFGGQAVAPLFSYRDPTDGQDDSPGTLESLKEVDEQLARWAGEHDDRVTRPSALLWFGHGTPGAAGPSLLVPGSKKRRDNARVTPDMLAHYILAEQRIRATDEGHWAIVLIEACNGAEFAGKLYSKLTDTQPKACSLLLVSTGKDGAQAYLGAFRAHLENYVRKQTSLDEVFTLRDLQVHLKSPDCYAELVGDETSLELKLRLHDRVPLSGAVTVAEHMRLQHEFEEEAPPYTPPPTTATSGFLEVVPEFTGRVADLDAVADWCSTADTPPVLVVTGAPGTGKSALLGEVLRRLRSGTPGTARIGAVLRLTGSTPADVVHQLADSLGTLQPTTSGPPNDETGPAEHPLDLLRRRLTALAAPAATARTLIIADALDEAQDPVQVACLLRDLTDIPGIGLLIGTRSSPYGRSGGSGARGELPAALGSTTGRARVRELAPDPDAAARYTERQVRRILGEHPAGDPAWQETVVHTVRSAVATHVRDGSWQFLQTALMVREIEQRPDVLKPDTESRTALENLLARDRTGLFGSAVARITEELPTAELFLRALAFAQGRGLPRADGLWAHAAAGITGSDVPLDDQKMSLFLSRAAAYVLLDGEDRRSVYRLAHRTYAEHLQASSTLEQRLGMLTALLGLAEDQAAAGQRLSPHLRSRLAQYAADCGARGWTELAGRPAVLDRLPPTALSTLALAPGRREGGVTPGDLPIEVLGTVTSAHLIKESSPGDRAGLRQLGGLRATGQWHPAGPGAAWEVCWGRLRTAPPHLQLGGADGAVSALAAHPSAQWLVSGSLDGTVLVWEPWRSHRPALLLRGCERPVSALASLGWTAGREGPGLLAAAHDDRTIQLWDTDSERPTPVTIAFPQVVRHMVALPDGTGRLALAGEAGHLSIFEVGGRPRIATALPCGDVVGLAPVTGTDGLQWLAVAYETGELALWDVSADCPSLLTQVPTRQMLTALTSVTDTEGVVRLVTAAEEGPVRFWCPTQRDGAEVRILLDGEAQSSAEDGRDSVLAALPAPDGGEVAVLGNSAGTLRVLGRHDSAGRTLYTGGPTRTRALVVLAGPKSGHAVVSAAGRDPRVHFWAVAPDAADAPAHQTRWSRHDTVRRQVLTDGLEVLVLSGPAGTDTRVLRAEDGEELARDELDGLLHSGGEAKDDTTNAPVPQAVKDAHQRRVQGWTRLLGDAYDGLWASVDLDGDVVLWRSGTPGSWQATHRIRLGLLCRGLVALHGGRLALATHDGVVVLGIGSVVAGADGSRTEEADA
ncbi:AAA family ATPase [Streptomyces cellulosae]|uniref:AAA family ATPase n=1 Tax=Streptomyces cellulosae TaxID=1968 RepID=UPI00131D58B6|nr:AAA family ATPase [Streptomyces cellulosae]